MRRMFIKRSSILENKMKQIKYTLIGDGSSDKTLMNIIKWLLNDLYPKISTEGTFADFRRLPNPPPKSNIVKQVEEAKKYFPFDILFYHRDAESNQKGSVERRIDEIKSQLNESDLQKVICVVPVRMMEAWILFDREAVKKAAGNRNFKDIIALPNTKQLENIPDPKQLLHDVLIEVSGLKGRNVKKFNVNFAVHLVAENIDDFSPLRSLNAFQTFENDLKQIVNRYLEA